MFDFLNSNSQGPQGADGIGTQLPLDITSIIISYLDSPGDLARVCRVSRIHHYLTIPLLYENVTLYATPHPPEVKKEGERKHSKFMAGLQAVSRPLVSGSIKKISFIGEFVDQPSEGSGITVGQGGLRVEEQQKWWEKGLWGDLDGMVAIALGGVLTRMTRLESFVWKINTYIHPFLYHTLSTHPSLKVLDITFPHPAFFPSPTPTASTPPSNKPTPLRPPIITVPVFPRLTHLKLTGLAGSPYSDDFSPLIFFSPKLQSIKMSWRIETVLSQFFMIQEIINLGISNKKITIKELGFQNMYLDATGSMDEIFETHLIESLTLLDCEFGTGFWSWMYPAPNNNNNNKKTPTAIRSSSSERVSASPRSITNSPRTSATTPRASATTPRSSIPQPVSQNLGINLKYLRTNSITQHYTRVLSAFSGLEEFYIIDKDPASSEGRELGPAYLDALFNHHGSTLKRLRLSAKWVLNREQVARLIRSCTGLIELAIAMEHEDWQFLQVLMPFLDDLVMFNLLDGPFCGHPSGTFILDELERQRHLIEYTMGGMSDITIKWIGVGAHVFRVERTVQVDATGRKRRPLKSVDIKELGGMGIFKALEGL